MSSPRYDGPELSKAVTPESTFVSRRKLIRSGVVAASAIATGFVYRQLNRAGGSSRETPRLAGLIDPSTRPEPEPATIPSSRPATDVEPAPSALKSTAGFTTDETRTPYEKVTGYNNFYEFSTDKEAVAHAARNFVARPWTLEVGGLVAKPRTFGLDEILKLSPPEERIYRMRCVEGWSMVVPWAGYSLSTLLERVAPRSGAKYVAFQTLMDPERMPGQQDDVLDWPYVEGLRMDEAMHPLTLLTSGVYGRELPAQNGAPLRLIVPWKYGFKGVKSIVKITLVDKEPPTTWNIANAREYGFYANVNPTVDHPRWSQATEERLDAEGRHRIPTRMFNGYADEVGSMYAGMDLRKYY